jgi:hypothetical protein
MNTLIETNGVALLGLSGYFLIYDPEVTDNVTAAVNSDLINSMADKIDPSILDAATSVAEMTNNINQIG